MGFGKDDYTRTYFLGGVVDGVHIGVDGYKAFRAGLISEDRKEIVKEAGSVEGKIVVDIGCGRGEILKLCSIAGARICYGTDFAPAAVEIARDFNYGDGRVVVYEQEAIDLDLPEKADIVFMADVVEHIPTKEMPYVYQGIRNNMNSGGRVVISTPAFGTNKSYRGLHCNYQTEGSLYAEMECIGFTDIDVWEWERKKKASGSSWLIAVASTP